MRRALLAIIASSILAATLAFVAVSPSPAVAASPEMAEILMPFDGQWANSFGTEPAVHNKGSADWAMDVYARGAPVAVNIGEASGAVTLTVSDVVLDATCGGTAGTYVRVRVAVDGVTVGTVLYHHLVGITVEKGDVISSGTALGRTVNNPDAFFGHCWFVSTPMGINTHIAVTNTVAYSCYVPHSIGESLDRTDSLARLGQRSDGRSMGLASRAPCRSAPVLLCRGQRGTIVGTREADELVGTAGPDVIIGLGGADIISGLGGDDLICGGPGPDRLHGGSGNDVIDGGPTPDIVIGGPGDDLVIGGAHGDVLYGGTGLDRLVGGDGADVVWGGPDNDLLLGYGGDDILYGQAGDDVLAGGDQNDRVWGGPGDDVLAGSAGRDRCVGGTGIDRSHPTCEVADSEI